MDTEYEVKVLDIDTNELMQKLKQLNAEHINDYHFKRYVFNTVSGSLNEWLRLRTDGKLTTLAYKNAIQNTIDGVEEIEFKVSDFAKTRQFLEKSGLKQVSYQENKRSLYKLNDVELAIDQWPHIPPYLEIEGQSKAVVENMLAKLKLNNKQVTSEPTKSIYNKYGLDLSAYKDLRFE